MLTHLPTYSYMMLDQYVTLDQYRGTPKQGLAFGS